MSIDKKTLRELLIEADDFAVQNVLAGNGGPFGAALDIFDKAGKHFAKIGETTGNAVIKKGIASAHAENEILSPGNVINLHKELARAKISGVEPVVVLSSSGESCPACHSKEEILARRLIATGLLEPGNFIVTYGATYEDTRLVAGFHDEPYHHDMKLIAGTGLVQQNLQPVMSLPANIAEHFKQAASPVAVIESKGAILAVGYDRRGSDLFATSEVSAIRQACQALREGGKSDSWDLEKATLYTFTIDIGPLAYAECQWANITNWVSIQDAKSKSLATKEADGIGNKDLFNVIAARPYNQAESAIEVIHIDKFPNRAQQTWRDKDDAILYNGAAVGSDLKPEL